MAYDYAAGAPMIETFQPERNRKPRALGIGVYTSLQVSGLSGVQRGSLGYWRRTGLIVPHTEAGRPGHRALYTYADLRELRVIRQLRRKGLALQRIRRAIEWLQPQVRQSQSWVDDFTLVTDGDRTFTLVRADEETPVGLPIFDMVQPDFSGHRVFTAFVGDIVAQFTSDPDFLYLREFAQWVDIRPDILAGAPVAKHTRIPTSLIWELTTNGWGQQELLRAYPSLTAMGAEMAVKFEETINLPKAA